jgi:hypothetical protein
MRFRTFVSSTEPQELICHSAPIRFRERFFSRDQDSGAGDDGWLGSRPRV